MKRLLALLAVVLLLLIAACNQAVTPEVTAPDLDVSSHIPTPPTTTLGVVPEFYPDNASCQTLLKNPDATEIKINGVPVVGMLYGGVVTVTKLYYDGTTAIGLDFTSTQGVAAVFMKGGPGGNLYLYDPPAMADTGLYTPINDNNNKHFQISHVSFCYVPPQAFPSVAIDKTGDELSKIGDEVNYSFTISNTGNVPIELVSVIDDVLGDLTALAAANNCSTLAVGASCTFSYGPWTVPPGAPDPLVNIVTATYKYGTAQVQNTDSHSLNLFQPSITFTKAGDPYSKAGDTINYVLKLTNTSSADTPKLVCRVLDPLVNLDVIVELLPGDYLSWTPSYLVPEGAPNPLVNDASVDCSPEGFPNVINATATWSTTILHPAFTVEKECLTPNFSEGNARFRVTLANTGDADLVFNITDPAMPSINGIYNIAAGGDPVVLEGEIAPGPYDGYVDNTVNAEITLAPKYGLSNTYTVSKTARCNRAIFGCTPGFWKQPHHFGHWVLTGYAPTQKLGGMGGVFDGANFANNTIKNATLVQALDFGGGGGTAGAQQILFRAAVASLLNLAHPDVAYGIPGLPNITTAQQLITHVINTVNTGSRAQMIELATLLDNANNAVNACSLTGQLWWLD